MDDEAQPLTGSTAGSGISRVRSIEQPLTAGPLSSSEAPPPSGMQLVPSSLDDEKVCRFCLESTDHPEPFHAEHLIAPCQCRGGSQWVHRGCLDEWRATRSDRAFSACTECFFGYEFVQPASEAGEEEGGGEGWLFKDGPLTKSRRLKMKFQLLVARDVVKVFVFMQIVIVGLAAWMRSSDCGTGTGTDETAWDCVEHNDPTYLGWYYSNNSDVHPAECCPDGDIVNKVFPFTLLKNHTRTAYYLVGLMIFCAVYGIFVSRTRTGASCCGDGRCESCCFGFCTDRNIRGGCFGCGVGCFQLGCAGAFAVAMLLFLALVLVVTVFGALTAAMAVSLAVQRSMQRHMHVLHKRNMVTQFIVEDLSGEGDGCRTLAEVLAERGGAAPNPALQPRQSQVTRGAHEIRAAAALRHEEEDAAEDEAPGIAFSGSAMAAESPDPEVGLLMAGSESSPQLRSSVGGRAVLDQQLARRTLREVGGL